MSARSTPKRRSPRQPIRMACEGVEPRLLMCGSHFSEAEFLAEFPVEAAMLKGELPPAYEEPAGPEGGPDAVNIRGLASDNFGTVFGGQRGHGAVGRRCGHPPLRAGHHQRQPIQRQQPD